MAKRVGGSGGRHVENEGGADNHVSLPRWELCRHIMFVWMATTIIKELRLKIRLVVLFTESTNNLRVFN